ncbi:MAG: hypothetical protein E6R03_16890 [Hyphomicrobiaceae bacterium]|nr:MAG: hypothetical protein E6R03_16890 [Hyphomicrobiaceae bacterium]
MTKTIDKPKKVTKVGTPSTKPGYERELAEQWNPLVIHVVSRWFKEYLPYLEYDLKSAANYGLLKSIRCWRADYISPKTGRPVRFNTYAINAMRQECSNLLRSHNKKYQRQESLVTYGERKDWDNDDGIDGIEDNRAAEASRRSEIAEHDRLELIRRFRRIKPVHVAIFMQYLGGFTRSDGVVMPRLSAEQLAIKYRAKVSHINSIVDSVRDKLGLESIPKNLFQRQAKDRVAFVEESEELEPEHIPNYQMSYLDFVKQQRTAC